MIADDFNWIVLQSIHLKFLAAQENHKTRVIANKDCLLQINEHPNSNVQTINIHRQSFISALFLIHRVDLNGTRFRDFDSFLGFSTSGSESFDFFYNVVALDDLPCRNHDFPKRKKKKRKEDLPKTTCAPSSQEVTTVVMKNCEPLVFFPALAMERRPGFVCLRLKFSSIKIGKAIGYFR